MKGETENRRDRTEPWNIPEKRRIEQRLRRDTRGDGKTKTRIGSWTPS